MQLYRSDGFGGLQLGAGGGGYYVSFGNNSTTGGTLQQTFDTVVGQVYGVSYQVGLENSALDPQSMKVEAFDGRGSLLGTQADNNFVNFAFTNGQSLTFTATSLSTTLIFTDTTQNSVVQNWGLGDVSVAVVSTPEPNTISLLFLATGTLAALSSGGRRNRRACKVVGWSKLHPAT